MACEIASQSRIFPDNGKLDRILFHTVLGFNCQRNGKDSPLIYEHLMLFKPRLAHQIIHLFLAAESHHPRPALPVGQTSCDQLQLRVRRLIGVNKNPLCLKSIIDAFKRSVDHSVVREEFIESRDNNNVGLRFNPPKILGLSRIIYSSEGRSVFKAFPISTNCVETNKTLGSAFERIENKLG